MNLTSNILPSIHSMLEQYFNEDQLTEIIRTIFSGEIEADGVWQQTVSEQAYPAHEKAMLRSNLRNKIDEIITYSESKLSRERYLMLLNNLGKLYTNNGEFTLAINIYNQLLKKASQNDKLENIISYTYLNLGSIYSRIADWKNAFKYVKSAITKFKKQKDLKGLARCENTLGAFYAEQGNLKLSREHLEKGLSYLSYKRDKIISAEMEGNLGTINSIQGNFDLAYTFHKRSLLKFTEFGTLKRIAEVRHNLGILYTQKKKYSLALAEFDICLDVSIRANYLPTQSISYLSKAFIYTRLEKLELAEILANKAMTMSHQLNDMLSIADIYKIKGIIQRKRKNFILAENYLLTSLRINNDHGNQLNYAETAFELGLLCKELNKKKDAKSYFNKSLKYYREIKANDEINKILSEMKQN